MPHVENDRIVESTNEARAGVTGQNVNYVVLISTVLVISLSGGCSYIGRQNDPDMISPGI
jgi:hypothetical protein